MADVTSLSLMLTVYTAVHPWCCTHVQWSELSPVITRDPSITLGFTHSSFIPDNARQVLIFFAVAVVWLFLKCHI